MDSKRLAYIIGAALVGTLIFVAVYHMNTGSFKLFASSGEEPREVNKDDGGESKSNTD